MSSAQELLALGDSNGALNALEQQVRNDPGDPKLRVFLFQLLAVTGQWQRALTQLQVCGELDTGTLAMVATYREALQCESEREAVFAGKIAPNVYGRKEGWVVLLAEALAADGRGETAAAATLRARALDAAPATSGSLDGKAFAWIADGDSRLGPVLETVIDGRYRWVPFDALAKVSIEVPADLRDMVWAAAQLTFSNGSEAVALLPTRYPGSAESGDGALQLARRTDWLELGSEHFRGLGQRVLVTDSQEQGVLEVREILLESQVGTADEAA